MKVFGLFAESHATTDSNFAEVADWVHFADLFPGEQLAVFVERVPHASVPEPYRRLLVHHQHMTGMMEQVLPELRRRPGARAEDRRQRLQPENHSGHAGYGRRRAICLHAVAARCRFRGRAQ